MSRCIELIPDELSPITPLNHKSRGSCPKLELSGTYNGLIKTYAARKYLDEYREPIPLTPQYAAPMLWSRTP